MGVCALGNIHRQGRLLKRGPHLPSVMKNPRCGALNRVQLSNSDGGNHHLPALGISTLRIGNHVEGKTPRAVEAVNDSQLLLVEFHDGELSHPTSLPVVAIKCYTSCLVAEGGLHEC